MKRTCAQCGHEQENGPTCAQCGAAFPVDIPTEPSANKGDSQSTSTPTDTAQRTGKRRMSLADLPDSLFEPIIDLPELAARRMSGERQSPMSEPDDPANGAADTELQSPNTPLPPPPPPPSDQPIVPRRTPKQSDADRPLMSYRPQVVQELDGEAPRRRRQSPGNRNAMLVFGAVALGLLLIVVVVLFQFQPDGPSTTEPGDDAGHNGTAVDSERWQRVLDRAADAVTNWKSIKQNPAYASFESRFAEIDRTVDRMRDALNGKNLSQAEQTLEQLDAALETVRDDRVEQVRKREEEQERQRQVAQMKIKAVDQQKRIAEARLQAEEAEAETYLPQQWKRAQSHVLAAEQAMEGEDYEKAVAEGTQALSILNDLHLKSISARFAHQSRAELHARLTAHFTEAQCRAITPESWRTIAERIAAGDAFMKQTRYQQAEQKFGQAMLMVPQMEQQIRHQLGVKFYAVQTGYLTAEVLLEVASGVPLTTDHFNRLRKSYKDLGLTEDLLRDLPDDPSAGYKKVALYLAVNARAVIDRQRGPKVTHTFAIGFYLRMLDRLLRPPLDTDALPPAALGEAKRTVTLIRRLSEQADCEDTLHREVDRLAQSLPARNDDPAVAERCRQVLHQLIDKLRTFDTAIGLLGVHDSTGSANGASR